MLYVRKPVKVKIEYHPRLYAANQVLPLLEYEPYLEGVRYVSSGEDILLIQDEVLDQEKFEKQKTPIIIIERADSSTITKPNVRKWIEDPKVVSVFKTTVALSKEFHHYPRYHYSLIGEHVERQPMSNRAIDKIKCIIPICLMSKYLQMRKLPVDLKSTRIYDAVYIANLNNSLNHRKQFWDSLKDDNLNIIRSQTKLGPQDWNYILMKSKVCVSPWGYGEMCYRDLDAIYCGCVLIKPNSGHMKSYPNIFTNENYLPCKIDSSDLIEKVREVAENWDAYYSMREKSRNLLVNFLDWKKRAKEFSNIIIECYNSRHK